MKFTQALSRRLPWLRTASIWRYRILRFGQWIFMRRLATERRAASLPFRVASHESILLRTLGDADMRLQHNKVTNLKLAASRIDGVVIKPGETFSLWRLVGWPTAKKGYVTGMLLSNGKVMEGIGGGLCQTANLIYWMALHSPLVVTERHRHSYDIFPDSGRVLPFGTGAAVYYNYVDLQIHNPTSTVFQINIGVSKTHLHGEIRSSEAVPYSYKIVERNHRFLRSKKTETIFRENEIYRITIDKRTGNRIGDDLLYKNHCKTLYQLPAETPVVEIA